VPAPPDKRRYVRDMFSAIAPRYDLLNRVLSLNVDRAWRRAALERLDWRSRPQGRYLDACAGTLDLAALLGGSQGFLGTVCATDFAVPMLRKGLAKSAGKPIGTAAADTLVLPFPDASFDGATVGFGVRNLMDLDAGFREFVRVLKPGARLVMLDCSTPVNPVLRALYLTYFRRVLPVIGRVVSGHPTAYSYLPESVTDFPQPAELEQRMAAAGLGRTGHQMLTGGIAALTWGVR